VSKAVKTVFNPLSKAMASIASSAVISATADAFVPGPEALVYHLCSRLIAARQED
jgi:hypothetical protein